MSVEYGILGLLSRRPMYGYELKEELQTEIGSHFDINYGSLYRMLDRLNRAGDVSFNLETQKNFPDKKIYSLTPRGEKRFRLWLMTPITGGVVLKNDFYVKLILSFTSSVNPADVIDCQRKADISLIQALTKLKQSSDEKLQIRWILLLDAAIYQTEARLKWLEICRTRLKDLDGIDKKKIEIKEIAEVFNKIEGSQVAKSK